MTIDWSTLTRAQASKRIGAADRAERVAAARWNASGTDEDEAAWAEAFKLWEDLRVYAICGEKPT